MAEQDNNQGGKPNAENVTFEAWLEGQSDEVKGRFEEGTQGLRKALSSERDNTKGLSKQLKELQSKVDAGSEAAKTIENLQKELAEKDAKIEESERRQSFMAKAAEAGCSNGKAAYVIAKANDLFKRNGDPDWDAIKETAPELFGKKQPNGNAGSGTDNGKGAGADNYMDKLIRRQLHRN